MEEIDLRELFDYIKDRMFYIITTIVLFVSVVIIYDCYIKVPTYSTYTTIALVKNDTSKEQLTQSDISVNQNLVDTYKEIVTSKKVLKQVIDGLNLDITTSELNNMINVSSLNNTEILKIKVTTISSRDSYRIAKVISQIFIDEIQEIYEMNNVTILDEAEVDKSVSNNTLVRDIFLSIVLGLSISGGILTIIFYFDDTFTLNDKTEEDLDMPVIAKIFKSRLLGKKEKSELVVSKYPKAVVSESIKMLRTNLQFSSIDKDIKTILVTSSIPGEGKSFISTNLSISLSETNKKILIVDSDMRKGRLHKIFNISNKNGYSDLLIDNLKNLDDYIKKTEINNLFCITRGTIPPNPSELLNSDKNKELIEKLKMKFDMIIFDGVPCSGLTDSIIMSKLVDKVVIVASNKYTPRSEIQNTKKILLNSSAPVAGIIINRIDSSKGKYKKYYYYYGEK